MRKMSKMFEKIRKKFVSVAPDWLYSIVATLYWHLHLKPIAVLLPHSNSWLFVYRNGSRIFQPKYAPRIPFAEPYERYFRVCPGEIVLDVGAGIGSFTIPAAMKAKKVIAVEANPENIVWLRKNVSENRLQNVHIIEKAAWNRKESLRLWLSTGSIGMHSLVKRMGGKNLKVQADTLDNIALEARAKKIDFVKLDIEGAEIETLEGAKHILNETKKVVLETHLRDGKKTTFTIQRFLKARGFRVSTVNRGDFCDMVYAEK